MGQRMAVKIVRNIARSSFDPSATADGTDPIQVRFLILRQSLIETNKEDEISLARFLRNFKELPLLDSFSDFPLSIKLLKLYDST